ncbi:hypothetical protein ACVIHI_004464 [Bradyrhizobium sp. USDA 4524]|uniref:hypothetical protein n=1 Tax=unclassified Bradyrhizobium TaxID=2631580 RepID=UPI0020A0EE3A|nr:MULTISPECIES: hypothetical protein [unclassified Bradyrhizobium]MCP1842619.1 hypothetical protein [Bradyrhizobium sp. USDA 4538]MCP1903183.1 hypothetical protein [Bradyrhizobium sp. USDA 4537]MCP1991160.1 hypothetical protein [Bradyrhizobium sp. USDA 4539]
MMDLTNIDGSPLAKSMLGKPVIFATVPNGPALKSRLNAEEQGEDLSAHGNAAPVDERYRDLSTKLAVEPHDCAGRAVHDVTMFGSLSRPGEPRCTSRALVPATASSIGERRHARMLPRDQKPPQ